MRLLIVDDEDIIRRGLMMMDWKSAGIDEVDAVSNGVEAIEILKQKNIDIIISDIKMPGLNGIDLAKYVSTHTQHTKMILLTGFSDFNFAQNAIKSGVCDYLLKPVEPKELIQSVKRAVQSLELDVYKTKVVYEYEEACSSLSIKQQILHGFKNVGDNASKILQYIAENFDQCISLDTLAKEYHFSTMHVSRMIKKETGYSFLDILTGIRLMNAAKLLINENFKINIICEKVGFNDQRYFSQVFKRVFSCTPMEYRKSLSEQKEYTIIEMLEKMN